MTLDPVSLQVLSGALHSICEEMGAVLIRSAHSANIKERQDCSTAIFDPAGELVMQAEHIPVHLGSMPAAVEAVLDNEHRPGDLWILNDPFQGGTHLPDITLISPVFAPREGGAQLGFSASRAHHADVGGPTPGSMPASSGSLEEEGVIIPPSRLDDELLEELVGQMRNPAQRRADLRAQRAANLLGAERLGALSERGSTAELREGMEAVLAHSERRARAAIAELPDGSHRASDVLEPAPRAGAGVGREPEELIGLEVEVTISGEELEIDFAGSSEQVPGNLNCPLSVTRSAALFAVRVLTDPDSAPSAGAHRPIGVSAPEGSILNARAGAAVVAGNVETSSRVADLVLSALGEAGGGPAQGQGTMNSVSLSGEGFTYYETIAGGQGACADADGPDAIHVAMSNTLNTPVEALEQELPVRVRELAVRSGSGGDGAHRGGDGVIREIEALEEIAFSVIGERRRRAPAGREGGSDGAPGRNLLDGEELPAKVEGTLRPGEVLRIETPGGGGYGTPR